MKIILCFEIRQEAIKIVPLVHELKKLNVFELKLYVTAQLMELQDEVLDFFEIVSDNDLDAMQPKQILNGLSRHFLSTMG